MVVLMIPLLSQVPFFKHTLKVFIFYKASWILKKKYIKLTFIHI